MSLGLSCGDPIDAAAFAALRRRALFECCKWDPQVGDVATLSRIPLLLAPPAWRRIASFAEALAREILDAEEELLSRPDLWRDLGLPWSVRRALRRSLREGAPRGVARLVRFDFHPTAEGWRISEANTDVPGGFVEAEGFTSLVADEVGDAAPAGVPATAYADALRRALPESARVALVHATAYADDRQVMEFLAHKLARRGLRPVLAGPEHLRWESGRARLECDWAAGEVDAVVRFFPAEWLPNCRRASGWRRHFGGGATPLSNPATALLTQSKRLPLVWDRMDTPLATWRGLLPETRSPEDVFGGAAADPGPEWVVKPALGRVGDGVGIAGVTPERERAAIVKAARRHRRHWIAQRRFSSAALESAEGPLHACLGVYTVDARAAGIYGRVSRRPLVDAQAQDAAVLVPSETAVPARTAGRTAWEVNS